MKPTLTIAIALLTVFTARAEVKVIFDRNAEGTPDFKFKSVPSPIRNSASARARFTIVDGEGDPNGANLRVIHDGKLPEDADSPQDNFFFAAGEDGGRFQIDLGSAIELKEVDSYSWHVATRAPQVYKLYASDGTASGFNATPKRDTDPQSCGWKLLGAVDTRSSGSNVGGQYGVSITDTGGALGSFRYLLFNVSRTEDNDSFGNTFYSEINVRAMTPAEPEALVIDHSPAAKDFDYTLDTTQAPELKDWAETKLRADVDKWYPIIRASLASDGYTAPKKFSIIIKPKSGVADTAGTTVNVSKEWITGQLKHEEWNEAAGSVVHELVHVVQQYKSRNTPGYLTEGVADYIRWFHYEPIAHHPKLRNAARAKYSDSYKTTAGFLNYVTHTYDHEFVVKLNAVLRQGHYRPDFWKDDTGMTIQDLWTEYAATTTPPAATPAASIDAAKSKSAN